MSRRAILKLTVGIQLLAILTWLACMVYLHVPLG